MASYKIYSADVLTYKGCSAIGSEEYELFLNSFNGSSDTLYAKMGSCHIPLTSQPDIPSGVIAISEKEAEEFDIEEESGMGVMITNSSVIEKWY